MGLRQERVAIRLRRGENLVDCDKTSSTRLVYDVDRDAEFLRRVLCNNARTQIGGSARPPGHNDLYGFGWIGGLRPCRRHGEYQHPGHNDLQNPQSSHLTLLYLE